MKIGILSDSHDNIPKIRAAITFFNDANCDMVIHAGDFISPFSVKEFKNLIPRLVCVFGNNDGEKLGLKRILGDQVHLAPHHIKIDGKKVLICHEPYELAALIQSQVYDVIIYGHTHDIDIRQEKKTTVINPGECGGWLNGKSTIATWDTQTAKTTLIEI